MVQIKKMPASSIKYEIEIKFECDDFSINMKDNHFELFNKLNGKIQTIDDLMDDGNTFECIMSIYFYSA